MSPVRQFPRPRLMNNLRSLSRRYGSQALLLSSALVFVTGSWQFITGGAALGDDHSSHLALGMHIATMMISVAKQISMSCVIGFSLDILLYDLHVSSDGSVLSV